MEHQWTCAQCNHQNPGTMQFCPHCGAAKPTPTAQPTPRKTSLLQGDNRRWWIIGGIILVLICAILAVSGGLLLGRRVADTGENDFTAEIPPTVALTPTPSPVVEIILSTRVLPTDTAVPARGVAPKPTATLTGENGAAQGDQLSLPTATPTPIPEGVIVFLSSRDYLQSTPLKLSVYAMRPDGSQQIRIMNLANIATAGMNGLYPYYKLNQMVVIGVDDTSKLKLASVYDMLQQRYVETLPPIKTLPWSSIWTVSWSKDGDMVFSYSGQEEDIQWAIYFLGRNQTEAKRLTYPLDAGDNNVFGDALPVWSPSGEWIAFSRTWYQAESDGIWLIRPDGSDAHRIIEKNTRVIAWSPDGTKLAFQGRATNDGFDLWVANSDGSDQKQLSFFPKKDYDMYDWPLAWTPDGEQVIFQVTDNRTNQMESQLYIVDADGSSEPRQLTFEGEYNGGPIWLPVSMDEILANAPTPSPPTATPKPVVLVPPAPTSCPSEGVQITSPRAGTHFTSRYNYIVGTANINRFKYWKLEYSTNPNGGWQYLFEQSYPVDGGQLMMLDASTVPRGPYGLRLTVVDETGNYPEPCVVWFTNNY